MPAPQPTPGNAPNNGGQPGDIVLDPLGGWLSQVPGSPFWMAREVVEAIPGVHIRDVDMPGEQWAEEHAQELIETAGKTASDIGTALVVTGVLTVGALVLVGTVGAVAYWKLA